MDKEHLADLVARERLDDPRIEQAFRRISRDDFVPKHSRLEAFEDRPISIPERQTTSQPTLIARMIDAAAPKPADKVLEVGTGYGFQTALLSRLADKVLSIDRFRGLVDAARDNLERAGIENVEVSVGDGFEGWAEEAPFDCIIVSAAAKDVPQALVEQLAEGGRLVIPLKRAFGDDVVLLRKSEGSVREQRVVTPARFVPLVPGTDR